MPVLLGCRRVPSLGMGHHRQDGLAPATMPLAVRLVTRGCPPLPPPRWRSTFGCIPFTERGYLGRGEDKAPGPPAASLTME